MTKSKPRPILHWDYSVTEYANPLGLRIIVQIRALQFKATVSFSSRPTCPSNVGDRYLEVGDRMETTERRCAEMLIPVAVIIHCLITIVPTFIRYAPLGPLSGSYLAFFLFRVLVCMFRVLTTPLPRQQRPTPPAIVYIAPSTL